MKEGVKIVLPFRYVSVEKQYGRYYPLLADCSILDDILMSSQYGVKKSEGKPLGS